MNQTHLIIDLVFALIVASAIIVYLLTKLSDFHKNYFYQTITFFHDINTNVAGWIDENNEVLNSWRFTTDGCAPSYNEQIKNGKIKSGTSIRMFCTHDHFGRNYSFMDYDFTADDMCKLKEPTSYCPVCKTNTEFAHTDEEGQFCCLKCWHVYDVKISEHHPMNQTTPKS